LSSSKFDQRVVEFDKHLTANEKSVIEYIHQHANDINAMTISQLAKEVHYSSSFISKVVKKIGYADFAEMRYELKDEVDKENSSKEVDVIEQQRIDIAKTNSLLLQTRFESINKLLESATALYVN